MSRQLSPIGAISPKQSPAAQHTIPVPLTITTSNLKSTITNLTSELSSLPGQSSLSWASKLLQRRTSKRPAGKLELGPSGAVVFRSRRSLDSISSATTSILDPSVLVERPTNLIAPLSPVSLSLDQRNSINETRSRSQESLRPVGTSDLRRRSSDNIAPRLPKFLGRHPPPIPRRSISLPFTTLPNISENSRNSQFERELLYIGDDAASPRLGYTKVPRLVPQRIQWDSTNTMTKRDRYGQASGSDCESLLAETGSSQGRDGSEHGGNPPGGHAGHGHAKGRKSLGKRIGKWVEIVVEGVKEKVKGLKKDSA